MEAVGGAPSVSLETSADKVTWTPFVVGSTTITLSNIGDKVYFRGDNPDGFGWYTRRGEMYNNFVMTGKIAASGNIMSLVDSTCESLTIPSEYCYYGLFNYCSSLITAPALPATILADYCYEYMFGGCTSLKTAPALPATKLVDYCYYNMFNGCTSLTTVPELPATILAEDCYAYMFRDCTSLTTTPSLPATILIDYCYSNMFSGCTSLITAPSLPATTLVNNCYDSMFNGCTKLNYIEVAFTMWISGTTGSWLYRVSSSGTFKCPAALPQTRGAGKIPEGWTIQTY